MFAKIFRNSLVASSLLVGASLIAGPAALAGPNDVSGTIAEISTVAFDGTEGTAIITGTAATSYPIGSLTVRDNRSAGWGLTVSSANGGKLVHTNATDSITYTALTTPIIGSSTATPVNLVAPNAALRLHNSDFNSTVAAPAGVTVNVTANLGTPSEALPAGTYSDTLTFTMVTKN